MEPFHLIGDSPANAVQVTHSLDEGFAGLLARLSSDPRVIDGEHTVLPAQEGVQDEITANPIPDQPDEEKAP